MRALSVTAVTLLLGMAACDAASTEPSAPRSRHNELVSPSGAATHDAISTGPTNRCYGAVLSGIASTWPWAHDDRMDFMPPPGATALWIQVFGPSTGVTSVRELQFHFCS